MSKKEHKAIVIGAGIAGCATAYHLAKQGWSVQLLERHKMIASAASGNPIAVLYPRLSDASSMLDQFALTAFTYTLQLLKSRPEQARIFQPCGLLQLASNAREQQRIDKVANRKFSNISIEKLTAKQASEVAGVSLHQPALYFAEAGYLLPEAFCKALTQHPNIQTHTDDTALSLDKNNHLWQVNTQKTRYEAGTVVICNAHDAMSFEQTAHLPMQTVRGQMSMVQADNNSRALACVLCGEGYVTPPINQQHCIGATFTPNSVDTAIATQDNLNNLQMAQALCDDLAMLETVNHARAALRATTADYLPLIGPVIDAKVLKTSPPKHLSPTPDLPFHDGMYVNIAHGSKGFTTAPLAAEMVANYVTGQKTLSKNIFNACQPNRYLLRDCGLKALNQHVLTQALSGNI